nr:MAG TPA_asm: hypothetical protein [Caudoviricetes sp.]
MEKLLPNRDVADNTKNPGHVRKTVEAHDRNFPKEMYQ